MKVLIAGEEVRVLNDVGFSLQVRYAQVDVVVVGNAREASRKVETESPDLVMVDSSLTGLNTLDMIREVRKVSDVPLIVITENENNIDRAQFLETGADEYIGKPVNPVELLSKLKALLRRVQRVGFQEERLITTNNGLSINFGTREVFISDRKVDLTPHEYDLLAELARNMGRTVAHRALLDRVWGSEYAQDYDFLKKYIYRLRSKLEPNRQVPKLLVNERGIGYRLVPMS